MRVRAGLVGVRDFGAFCLSNNNIDEARQNIYKKALVLSSDERGRSTGDIVNMMSVDTVRLQELCTYGFIAISGPLQVRFRPTVAQIFVLKQSA